MKENDLISVIIPVYNVEKYVGKCLESIVNQTYNNLEIIVVNDGSTDNSLSIIRDYAKKEERIIIVDKKNGGLSDARNHGIEKASGKYITFIDSDDFADLKMIEILYNNLKESNKKISICNRYYYYEDGTKKVRFKNNNQIKILNKEESYINLLNFIDFDMSAWAKLYDIKLFNKIRFPVGKLSEDYYIMYLLFDLADGIVYDSTPLLYYLQQRKGSITKKNTLIMDYVYAAKQQMEYICQKYEKLSKYAKSAYCLSYFTVYNKSIYNGGNPNKQIKSEIKEKIKKYGKSVKKNEYIKNNKKLQIYIFKYFFPLYKPLVKIYKSKGE